MFRLRSCLRSKRFGLSASAKSLESRMLFALSFLSMNARPSLRVPQRAEPCSSPWRYVPARTRLRAQTAQGMHAAMRPTASAMGSAASPVSGIADSRTGASHAGNPDAAAAAASASPAQKQAALAAPAASACASGLISPSSRRRATSRATFPWRPPVGMTPPWRAPPSPRWVRP